MVSAAATVSATSTKRIDPEYFQQAHLHDEILIKSLQEYFRKPDSLTIKVDASAFYPSIEDHYSTGDLPFLRVGDVDGFVDVELCERVPLDLCIKYPTLKQVAKGDLLFTKGGAIDRVGYVTHQAAVSRDLIFLTTSHLPPNDRLFFFVYFGTDFFKRMLLRSSSQTTQPHLTVTLVRELPIFVGSSDIRSRVAAKARAAFEAQDQSVALQAKAETILLDALGLGDWTPPEPLTYTGPASGVFVAGQLDAQYFMPAKQAVLKALAARPGETLGERFRSVREMFDPNKPNGIEVVRNFDVTDGLVPILDDQMEPMPVEEIGSIKKKLRTGDVAISRLRAYLKQIAVVRTSPNVPAVGSSEFIVLRPRDPRTNGIAPETLVTFLRSQPVQSVLKWCQDGSQHPRFSESDLLAIPVPYAVADASGTIEATVKEGFAARAKARSLLDAAKRAVEIAIERSEAEALRFLDDRGA